MNDLSIQDAEQDQAAQQPSHRRFWQRLTARFSRTPRPRPVPVAKTSPSTGTPAGGERMILGVAVAVLLLVAAAAAYVSYHHFYALAIALGERNDMAVLYPAMSDGVIVMASLVILYCSRRGLPVPVLAKAALALGGLVTLASNVAHGWDGGTGSRLLSALAPVAFVGAYELLMWLVRNARPAAEVVEPEPVERVVYRDVPVEVVVEVEVPTLAADRFEAARLVVEEAHRSGRRIPGRRALSDRWGIEIREAVEILEAVAQEFAPPAPPEPPTVSAAPEIEPLSRKVAEEEEDDFPGVLGEHPIDREEFLRTGALVPPAEPTDEELFAGMTPAEALSGPGATELRRQWRERAAVNGHGPAENR